MDLLPMIDKPAQSSGADSYQNTNSCMETRADQSAQMTIFYDGQVIVFDDLPPEKANKIMMLASNAALSQPNTAQNSAASFPKFASAFELQERGLCIPHHLLGSGMLISSSRSNFSPQKT